MPAEYLKKRNECYKKKTKDGKLSEEDKKACKKQAAIWYWKTYHKTVVESNNVLALEDGIVFSREYYEFFFPIKKGL